jgi:hypothetical protein
MAKASSKSAKKTTAGKKAPGKKGPIIALYAAPIRHCAATGNLRDMKSMAAKAKKHISDVQAALAKLEQSIAKLS